MEHLHSSLPPPSLLEPPPLINQKLSGREAAYGATGRAWSGLWVCFSIPLNHRSLTASINTWLPHRQGWCESELPRAFTRVKRPIMFLPLDTGKFHPRESAAESHSGTATRDLLPRFLDAGSGRRFPFHLPRNQEQMLPLPSHNQSEIKRESCSCLLRTPPASTDGGSWPALLQLESLKSPNSLTQISRVAEIS